MRSLLLSCSDVSGAKGPGCMRNCTALSRCAHICGSDLVRDSDGTMYVLEVAKELAADPEDARADELVKAGGAGEVLATKTWNHDVGSGTGQTHLVEQTVIELWHKPLS